jgi:hypothetical protein
MRSRAAVEEAAGEISGTALGFGRRQGRGGGLPLWLVRWGSETGESEGGDETGEIGTREEYDRWAGSQDANGHGCPRSPCVRAVYIA